MASPTKINIIDGERGKLTRRGWEERERIAIVPRVGGDGYAKLNAAIVLLQADASNDAEFGDEHPGAPNCFLEELIPEAITSDDVRIRMVYKYPEFSSSDGGGESSIEVGASLLQETVNTDIDGNLMTVEYNGQSQAGSVSIPVPQTTVRYQLRLSYSPGALAREFVGKVNSGGWWADPGAAIATWLCTAIVGTSNDGGQTYLTSFEFAFLEDGYDEQVVYIDPATGRMPDDIVIDEGVKIFAVIPDKNFNSIPH